MSTMKRFQRFGQRTAEVFGRGGEKSDKLTAKLAEIEKKVEGIRSGCQITLKKLAGTFVGTGSTLEKHQKRIPQYTLGLAMVESGASLGQSSLFGEVLQMVGQAQQDIASQMSHYEITVMHEIISELNTMLEEDMKKVDKAKRRLGGARLDMDAARHKLKSFEQTTEKSSREYNMEKLQAYRLDVDETSKVFEDAQDAYATEMFDFLSKEHLYTEKIQELVLLQITHYKNAAVQLEVMLPSFEKKLNETLERPVFGEDLLQHLAQSKRDIAMVLEVCCTAIRKTGMETEGLFRIAAGSAKVKFLKSGLDAGQTDTSAHDTYTIAGCLKMYLRELPNPILTYELYPEWIKAAGIGDYNDRLQLVWAVKEKLPKANLDNLKYLIAFLHEFVQYSEVTKMSVNNTAIVIGPNLLWPKDEDADPLGMVTETALQRRLTEVLIEHCHWFFPDLPETPPPVFTEKRSYGHSIPPQSPSSSSNSFSSSQSVPLSPHGPSDTSSNVSTESENPSIASFPLPKVRDKLQEQEKELPHPLADHALSEGINVQLVDSRSSSGDNTPSPKTKKVPPPVTPYKPLQKTSPESSVSSSPHIGLQKANSSDPPSPIPKPRHGTSSSSNSSTNHVRTTSGEVVPVVMEVTKGIPNGTTSEGTPRPTPPTRVKRVISTPQQSSSQAPVPSAKPSPPAGKPGARGPLRRAPPPPVSKKPSSSPPVSAIIQDDEMSSL